MNKEELIRTVARKSGVTVYDTTTILNTLIYVIQDTVADGEELRIEGFGKFYSYERGARNGRNPHTGEHIVVPPITVPKFTASSKFGKFGDK